MEIDLTEIYQDIFKNCTSFGDAKEIIHILEKMYQNAYDEGFAKGLGNTENIYWNRPLDKDKITFKY